MSREEIRQSLVKAAVATLEKLAFMFSFPIEGEEKINLNDAYVASAGVVFEGPLKGALLMRLPKPAVLELAANMLGMPEDEVGPEQQEDALGETVNVVCGNVLPALAGGDTVFKISPPVIALSGKPLTFKRPEADPVEAFLELEEGMCQFSLYLPPTVFEREA